MRRRIALTALALVTAVVGCRRSEQSSTPPYNVLLLSLDTVRRDVLGSYGHRPRHAPDLSPSPTLDQLARQGVRMVDAYSASSWTLPSHISMMTGVPPLVHGVEVESAVLAPAVPTMAEILQRHKYRTAGIYSAPYLDPHWGFGRGFETYTPVYGERAAAASARAVALRADIESAARAADWPRYDELKRSQVTIERELNESSETVVTSQQVAAAAVATIEQLARQRQPWFVFAHFFDAHCDYVPPPPYDTRFDPDYAGSFTGAHCMAGPEVGTPDPNQPGALIRHLPERDLEHAFALYEGEVAWVDANVATILQALERSGAADRTLVVVVADHGEEFFEHAGLGHRRTLYEEVVRIPMLMRLPGVLTAGTTAAGPVSLTDLLPTVLDVLGLPAEPTPGSASFRALLNGTAEPDRTALSRTIFMFGGEVQVDAAEHIALRQVVVQDGFRKGRIKITRRRSWPQFPAGLAPALTTTLQREAAAQYEHEDLRWIDVERFPDEPAAQQSTDFSDPSARAVLADFRRRYEMLLPLRTADRADSPLPQNVRSALESLGYIARSGPAFPEPDVVRPRAQVAEKGASASLLGRSLVRRSSATPPRSLPRA